MFLIKFFIFQWYFLRKIYCFFAGCFLVAHAMFWFRRNVLIFYLGAQSYADKMHGLCRLPSGVKKMSLVFCSKSPAKTLNLFILTKEIESIFSTKQKAVFYTSTNSISCCSVIGRKKSFLSSFFKNELIKLIIKFLSAKFSIF